MQIPDAGGACHRALPRSAWVQKIQVCQPTSFAQKVISTSVDSTAGGTPINTVFP
jgi:hypothetical protein